MALLETKIIQVENDPSTINTFNEVWGYFGWSVQSVQVTHSQDSRVYSHISSVTDTMITTEHKTETTTINYATITYQRDKHMPHYEEIAALDDEYWALRVEITDLNKKYQNLLSEIDQLQNGSSGPGCLVWVGICIGGFLAFSLYEAIGRVFGMAALLVPVAIVAIVLLWRKMGQQRREQEAARNAQERKVRLEHLKQQQETMSNRRDYILNRLNEIQSSAKALL